MLRIVIIMLTAAIPGAPARAAPSTDACAFWLTRLNESVPPAAEGAAIAGEIARRVGAGASGLGAAIDHLVREKAIPVARAQTFFADPSLARFSRLFLMYLIAELRARGFDDEAIVRYASHAARAYPLGPRVDLAIGVAARLMTTLNDEPSTGGPAGLDQFSRAARAFDLDETDYAEFLDAWRMIRAATAPSAVHFVMAIVERLSAELATERDERVLARDAAPGLATRWLGVVTGLAPNRAPSRGQIARALLAELEVPEFVTGPPWRRDGASRALIARYLRSDPTVRLGDVDLAPPFARMLILAQIIPHLGPAELRCVPARPEWPRLGADLRAAVIRDVELFTRVDTWRARLRDAATIERETAHARAADPAVAKYFFERFDAELDVIARTYRAPRTNARVRTVVTNTFDKTRAKFPRLGAPEVLVITRRVIDAVAATDLLHATVAAARAMMLIATEFDLDEAERRSITRQIRGYEFTAHNAFKPITHWPCAEAVLDEAAWGSVAPATPAVTRDIAKILERVRRAFGPDEVPIDDQTLLRLLIQPPPPPRAAVSLASPAPPPRRRFFPWDRLPRTEYPECGTEIEY